MITHFDNLDYFNKKRLLDNEVYAYLTKLKELKNEIPEVGSGLDYYKMWLSQYNKNKNSITERSNVEKYVWFICEKRRVFDKTIEYIDKEFNKLFDGLGNQVLIPMLEFIFDIYNIKTIKKLYKINQKDIIIGLNAMTKILKNYWK